MEKKLTQVVELRPAFAWTCHECGNENYCTPVVPEFSQEDLAELRSEHGVQPWETGHFLVKPAAVKCHRCAAEFQTEDFDCEQ